MTIERTVSTIKPDTIEKNIIGRIYSHFEENGLRTTAAKMKQLSERETEEFYVVRKGRLFYEDSVKFMTRSPVMIQVLEGENAVAKNRGLMGATNPADVVPGVIRADFAESVSVNTAYGSDSVENVAIEIAYFSSQSEVRPQQK